MNSLFYYAFQDKEAYGELSACSRKSEEFPLSVNCAGNYTASYPFTTYNPSGRKDFYLFYVTSGKMSVTVGDKKSSVSSGDAAIIPPHCPYKFVYGGNASLSYLWVHFTGSYAQKLLEECDFSDLPQIYSTEDNIKIPDSFHRLFEIFQCHSKHRQQELAHALEGIILSLSKSIDSKDEGVGFEKSLRFIHSSYNQHISVPKLAEMEMLSNSRYITLFKELTGVSPSVYIINLRVNAACQLLQSTNMSIKQIGAQVGYSDSHFFSKLFKKYTGFSPKSYRENIMG